jgi:hypothetical protein
MNQVPVSTRVPRAVHPRHRLVVPGNTLNADDRTEALLRHHAHAVVDVDQHLGREIRAPGRVSGEGRDVDEWARAGADGLRRLPAHELGGCRLHQRTERRLGLPRIPEPIGAHGLDQAFDEGRVHGGVHVDALDPAAGLPGVEEGAVRELLGGEGDVGVRPHVGRILAPELQPHADEALRGGPGHRTPRIDRAGKGDEVQLRRGDHALRIGMTRVHDLEHALRQVRDGKRLGEALGTQRRLGGVAQHDRVAGQQRRHDRVHGREIRVVPRCDREHHTERVAANETPKAFPGRGLDRRQGFLGDGAHVARPLLEPVHLSRAVGDGAPHLERDLLRDRVALRHERIDEGPDEVGPLGDRATAPVRLGRACASQSPIDLRVRGKRALDHDLPVRGRHHL